MGGIFPGDTAKGEFALLVWKPVAQLSHTNLSYDSSQNSPFLACILEWLSWGAMHVNKLLRAEEVPGHMSAVYHPYPRVHSVPAVVDDA